MAKALAKAALSTERVADFERMIDQADAELAPLRAFVLPAGTPKAASLHVARTVCRRAERSVVSLSHEAEVPELFLVYLNRLSDLLFTLARLANHGRRGRRDLVSAAALGPVRVTHALGSYPVYVETGVLTRLEASSRSTCARRRIAMIADAAVYRLYGRGAWAPPWTGETITVPPGETLEDPRQVGRASPTSCWRRASAATAASSRSAAA